MLSSRRNLGLACALSALAGYVDGIGFLHLGGLFVSFMSGNSTRLAVSLAEARWGNVAEALGIIALFVLGSAIGSLIVCRRGFSRQPHILLLEAALLAGAALANGFGWPGVAIAAMTLAMGIENAVFQGEGGAGIALTYVTGALAKVGQLAAVAIRGGPRWEWLPNLLLWASLVSGAIGGAFAYRSFNLSSVWLAAAVALALSGIVAATKRQD